VAADAELKELVERYRLLSMATQDLVYDYDYRTGRCDWNEGWKRYGYEAADVQPDLVWWEEKLHPEEKDRVIRELALAMGGQGGPFVCAYRWRCKDGAYRYVTDRGYVVKGPDGAPVRLVGAMQDAHVYGQMFARSPQPMWAFHRETLEFLAVNEAAVSLYGYTREEFLGMHVTDVRPPEDIPMLMAAVRSADRNHEGRSIWRHFKKSGELLYVEVRTSDFEYEGLPARLAQIQDVTRRVVLEEQLRESQKMDAIAALASGVAHDFNNVLTVIQGYARGVLKNLHPSDPARRDLEAIAEAGDRAAALTRQLLEFARKQAPKPAILVLNEVVSGLQPLLEKLLEPGVRLRVNAHPELRAVKADRGQMEQVLLNLVGNAKDACGEDGRVVVSTANVEMTLQHPDYRPGLPVGQYVMLSVEDNGCGMGEEVKRRVFEPFFTTKEKGKGTGLGLPTVYGIVRQHGGWIAVESEEGTGSAFRVYLPELPFRAGETGAAEDGAERKRRVLLVEDEQEVASFASFALREAGYEVEWARTGAEAKLLFRSGFDAVVCDGALEGERGADVVAVLREADPALKVLYVSGRALSGTLAGSPYLAKPFRAEELVEKLEELLAERAKGNRVLLVEDDAEIRRLLRDALQAAGLEVEEAGNGMEALVKLEQREFAVMVTDLVMPEREGLETIQQVKNRFPRLPVIAMSGAFAGQFLPLAKKFGADGVIAKPLSGEELVREVRRFLR
jgi:two-component system, cell cycle sensor histidine kinase and response regulator CckA